MSWPHAVVLRYNWWKISSCENTRVDFVYVCHNYPYFDHFVPFGSKLIQMAQNDQNMGKCGKIYKIDSSFFET